MRLISEPPQNNALACFQLRQLTDPSETAESARLIYVDEKTPGIRRKRYGRGFTYYAPSGERITDRHLIARIKSLAIPPAWERVWIAVPPQGHIQATGRDARGRKQYVYHPKWQEIRNLYKFEKLYLFGKHLSRIRARVARDLSDRSLSRESALAFIVRLLDVSYLRIGNPEYARLNNSYGLTTLRTDHVEICGAKIHLSFPGKRQKHQVADIHDGRLARLAKKYQELPGQELVRYRCEDGSYAIVESGDVNAYLEEITGEKFTAKDFRTWGGTVLAAAALYAAGSVASKIEKAKIVTLAIKRTAARLGNTPAICRKYYVHPAVVQAYQEGELAAAWEDGAQCDDPQLSGLAPEEKALMVLLETASTLVC